MLSALLAETPTWRATVSEPHHGQSETTAARSGASVAGGVRPRSGRRRLRHPARFLALLAALVLTVGVVVQQAEPDADVGLSVRVEGNQLVDARGDPVQLRGVNRSGAEFACVKGEGIFDGPADAASVVAMRDWSVNAVRVPLNAHCWLGVGDIPSRFSGPAYRLAITHYVTTLNDAGMFAILDLHWTAPLPLPADRQRIMPDADHSIAFWRSVAETFASTPGVLFDLFNEPHDVDWPCWRDGCVTPGGWHAAGMQELVDTVRHAGAVQPVLVAGLGWANDLTRWLTYRPRDPLGQLVAAFHVYPQMSCSHSACWDREIAPVARVVPVVTGEVGGGASCDPSPFVRTYTAWADAHAISWLAWTWNTWRCDTNLALITSYDGAPTPYGLSVRAALTGRRQKTRRAPGTGGAMS
jgi:endoglucanase